jgi:hypothetical protein
MPPSVLVIVRALIACRPSQSKFFESAICLHLPPHKSRRRGERNPLTSHRDHARQQCRGLPRMLAEDPLRADEAQVAVGEHCEDLADHG